MNKKYLKFNTVFISLVLFFSDLLWLIVSQILAFVIYFNKTLSFYQIFINVFFILLVLVPILRIYELYYLYIKKNVLDLIEKSLLAFGAFFVIFSTIVYFMNQNEFKLKFIWILTLTVFLMAMSIITRLSLLVLFKLQNKRIIIKNNDVF